MATLAEVTGREIGVSGWVVVDRPRVDAFAECTGAPRSPHASGASARIVDAFLTHPDSHQEPLP